MISAVCTIALEKGKARSQQLLQAVYFGVSLGAIVSPPLAQPFLSKTHLVQIPSTSNDSQKLHPIKFSGKIPTPQLNETATGQDYYYSTPTKVMYFYLIIGCFHLLPSLNFLCLYLSERKEHEYESFAAGDDKHDSENRTPLPTEPIVWSCSICAAFGMLFMFSMLFFAIQHAIGNLLTAFAVKSHLHLQKIEGNYLTMVYWISMAVGRLFGILLVNCLKAATMLVCELIGGIVATVVILTFYHTPYLRYVLWGMACLLGLSLSTINASILSWAAENLRYERYTVNIIFIGECIGFLAGPSAIAALFKSIGPITLMTGSGTVMALLFVLFITMMCTVPKHPTTNEVNKAHSH